MTAAEQAALLKATAAHAAPRDHLLYSMALGTGLRLSELLGLVLRSRVDQGGGQMGNPPEGRTDSEHRERVTPPVG